MKASRIAVGISCCLILATGCAICQDPYYDCGPVWSRGSAQNCNPDYRAGSMLNRGGPDAPATGDAPRVSGAASRAALPAGVAAHRSDGSEPRIRATTVAQQPQTPKPAQGDRQATRKSPKSDVEPTAPSPKDVLSGTVPAPPGTKQGDTRILSVTDRRLDELQRTPKPLAADSRKSPQRTVEKPSEDLGGWRPVATHQVPTETATQLREIDR